MAHKAFLYIENKKYYVWEFEYQAKQEVAKENENQAAERPKGGTIEFQIVTTDDDDMIFHQWMASPTEKKDGKFGFAINEKSVMETKWIYFFKALCTGLKESINKEGKQMMLNITLECETIVFGKPSMNNFAMIGKEGKFGTDFKVTEEGNLYGSKEDAGSWGTFDSIAQTVSDNKDIAMDVKNSIPGLKKNTPNTDELFNTNVFSTDTPSPFNSPFDLIDNLSNFE